MKFLEKVKNMFTEEVEEEVKPIKTEVRKVEIPAPVKPPVKEEETREEGISENENLKKEEKFKFPVYFDDKDFDKLPATSVVEKKEEPKRTFQSVPKEVPKEPVRKEAYGGKNPAFSATIVKEEKKVFKPTPIISPVYGILDKNYKKDDITPRKKVTESRISKELTVDDIRNKAFGTLEDDLETTLFGKTSILFNNEVEESENEESINLFDELEEEPRHQASEEKSIPSRVEKNKELELMNEVNELENLVINERPEIEIPLVEGSTESLENSATAESSGNMIEDEMDKICSEKVEDEHDLTESDLFNLIDSMYEKKDGEE